MSIFGLSVGVIIPALNEERALPLVLADLPRAVDTVVVVDNGSTDKTAQVAARAGAHVVHEPERGYGAACQRGMAEVGWHDVIVFLDGDHSDYAEELPRLVEPIALNRADFVLGSRLLGHRERGSMPLQSVWGNRLACFLMRPLLGIRYTDLGPFRAIRQDCLLALGMQDRNFGWTVEMQIKAFRAGLRIREVPVPYRRRVGQSKISSTLLGTLRAGYKILVTIARYGLLQRNLPPAIDRPARRGTSGSQRPRRPVITGPRRR